MQYKVKHKLGRGHVVIQDIDTIEVARSWGLGTTIEDTKSNLSRYADNEPYDKAGISKELNQVESYITNAPYYTKIERRYLLTELSVLRKEVLQ